MPNKARKTQQNTNSNSSEHSSKPNQQSESIYLQYDHHAASIAYITNPPSASQQDYLDWYKYTNRKSNVSHNNVQRQSHKNFKNNGRQNFSADEQHNGTFVRNNGYYPRTNSNQTGFSSTNNSNSNTNATNKSANIQRIREPSDRRIFKSTGSSPCATTSHPRLLWNEQRDSRPLKNRKRELHRPANTSFNWIATAKNGPSDRREKDRHKRVEQNNSSDPKPVFPEFENKQDWVDEENWDNDSIVIHVQQRTIGVQVLAEQLLADVSSPPSPITESQISEEDTTSTQRDSGGEKVDSVSDSQSQNPKDTKGLADSTEDFGLEDSVSVDHVVLINRINQLTKGLEDLKLLYIDGWREREELLGSLSSVKSLSTVPKVT